MSRGEVPKNSLRVGISKMLTRWKTETRENSGGAKSFTQKKGVNIDPINVFGAIRRDQSLDSATRRGLFHKKGAFSPKSPKEWLEGASGRDCGESSGLLSPSLRRCCLECPEEGTHEGGRRLSRGEGGSDSSKDGSIQSDTSLDSEDSCVSVIFVPSHEDKVLPSQPSTSNSSESSESPTGWASPESAKPHSPVKLRTKKSDDSPPKVPSPEIQETEEVCGSDQAHLSPWPRCQSTRVLSLKTSPMTIPSTATLAPLRSVSSVKRLLCPQFLPSPPPTTTTRSSDTTPSLQRASDVAVEQSPPSLSEKISSSSGNLARPGLGCRAREKAPPSF